MSHLPSGTLTFWFTDIEGSTGMLNDLGRDRYTALSDEHFAILRSCIEAHQGVEVRTEGDSMFAVFVDAKDAVSCAVSAQRQLQTCDWGGEQVWVRMGLHTGAGELGGDDYVGLDVNRAARIADAGNGGQILTSAATVAEMEDAQDLVVTDLGRFRLKDFGYEHLFQVGAEGLRSTFPDLRTLGSSRDSLPRQASSFIGRGDDVAEVANLLRSRRLVTLIGPGGIGKTRLSIEVARSMIGEFGNGVEWVPLADVNDPGQVPVAIGDAIGLRLKTDADALGSVTAYLENRELLLVLDNFEQLADDASTVGAILDRAPGVRVLATSRVPLRLASEQEFPVDPLTVANRSEGLSESVALFIDRAQTVDPSFELSAANEAALHELSVSLEGVPLAIELAASRVKSLSISAINERLDNRLLASRSADRPSRQQTMAGTIQWSFDLLTASQQALLRRMSVFVGGAALDEIEALVSDDRKNAIDYLEDLSALVDHSLVRREGDRYVLLRVIREFAGERLADSGEVDEYSQKHADIYAQFVRQAAPHLLSSQRVEWMARVALEHDNIRAALDHAYEKAQTNVLLELVSGMWRFWQTRGPLPEAADRVARALAMPGGEPEMRARAHIAAGGIAYWGGDFNDMAEHYHQAVSLLEESSDRSLRAEALYNLSFANAAAGNYDEARRLVRESAGIYEEIGDEAGVARSLYWGEFDVAWYEGRLDLAGPAAKEALARFEKLDRGFDYGWACYAVADSLAREGHLDEASEMLGRAVKDFLDAGDLAALTLFLYNYAAIASWRDDDERAALLLGAAQSIMERTGIVLSESEVWAEPTEGAWGSLRDLKDSRPDTIMRGRRMSPEEAVFYAIEG